jgi:glycosyltransferase involved in cell wall biosynthesis
MRISMEVALFDDKLNVERGGSNFSLELVARSLVERGHRVAIVTVNFANDNVLPPDRPFEVIEKPVRSGSRVSKAKSVHTTFGDLEDQFDVFHVFNPALLPVAGWYKRRGGALPVVGRLNTYDIFCTDLGKMDGSCHNDCTVRQKFEHDPRSRRSKLPDVPKFGFDTFALPPLMNEVDRLFALSPAVKEVYEGIGVDGEKIEIVPNFYDPAFSATPSDKVSRKENRILYVGPLHSFKGVDVLIDSLEHVNSPVDVQIVGDGPELENLRARATSNGVSNMVTFEGRVDHELLREFYAKAGIFVHPARFPEPFNRTLLEAMQYRCSMVVPNFGGPPWVIDDCGLTFEPNDANSLADSLNALLENESLRSICRNRCEERIEFFKPGRVISLIEKQYEAVI